MTEKHNGGPAYPTVAGQTVYSNGMSLRDYFAGQALAGWLASFSSDDAVKSEGCARLAYELADAMLQARK